MKKRKLKKALREVRELAQAIVETVGEALVPKPKPAPGFERDHRLDHVHTNAQKAELAQRLHPGPQNPEDLPKLDRQITCPSCTLPMSRDAAHPSGWRCLGCDVQACLRCQAPIVRWPDGSMGLWCEPCNRKARELATGMRMEPPEEYPITAGGEVSAPKLCACGIPLAKRPGVSGVKCAGCEAQEGL